MVGYISVNNIAGAVAYAINKMEATSGLVTASVFEDFYLLGFFDLNKVSDSQFKTIISHYRDLALVKALYWRMFDHFRWLVQATSGLNTSKISENLFNYGGFSDAQLHDLANDSGNKVLTHNLQACQEFLKKWQPAFAGQFEAN